MPLFQQSLLEEKLLNQDQDLVLKGYKKFKKYFNNTTIQENIRNKKEEGFQQKILMELFVKMLGYSINDGKITSNFEMLNS